MKTKIRFVMACFCFLIFFQIAISQSIDSSPDITTNIVLGNQTKIAFLLSEIDRHVNDTIRFFSFDDQQRQICLDSIENIASILRKKYFIYPNLTNSPVFNSLMTKRIETMSTTEFEAIKLFFDLGEDYLEIEKFNLMSSSKLDQFRRNLNNSSIDSGLKNELNDAVTDIFNDELKVVEKLKSPKVIIIRKPKSSWTHWLGSGLFIPGIPMLVLGTVMIVNTAQSGGGFYMLAGIEIAAIGLICDLGGAAIITAGEIKGIKYRQYLEGIDQLKSIYPENEILEINE